MIDYRDGVARWREAERQRIARLGDGLDAALEPIRRSGYCRGIIHYQDGCVWLLMHGCYDGCGRTIPAVRDLFAQMRAAGVALVGHDDSRAAFGRRCGMARRVERL